MTRAYDIIDRFVSEGRADARAGSARANNPYASDSLAGRGWDLGWTMETTLRSLPTPARWAARVVWKVCDLATALRGTTG